MSFLAVFIMLFLFLALPVILVIADITILGLKLGHIIKTWWWFVVMMVITTAYLGWVYWMEHHS